MRNPVTYFFITVLLSATGIMNVRSQVKGQVRPHFKPMPSLPDRQGWAGMFAGVSQKRLFCMGGANFPDQHPWEGGKKKWYDHIYMLEAGGAWQRLDLAMREPLAYGVSVTYGNQIIVAGGCGDRDYSDKVSAYQWINGKLQQSVLPDLPEPRAFMAGAIVGNLLIIAGGTASATAEPSNKCFALDLSRSGSGWATLDTIPGPGMMLPAAASFEGQFYLFSGQREGLSAAKVAYSHILQDVYQLHIDSPGGVPEGHWTKRSPMPKGVSGIGNPIPVLRNGKMLFWGGVDAFTNLHQDPSTFPGIPGNMLWYDASRDTWSDAGTEFRIPARVTLPVVFWKNQWVYISGEIKSGIRTNTVFGVQ